LAFAPAFAGPLLLVIGFRYDKLARSFLDALHVAVSADAYAMQLALRHSITN
jgi:hypothetical protein